MRGSGVATESARVVETVRIQRERLAPAGRVTSGPAGEPRYRSRCLSVYRGRAL